METLVEILNETRKYPDRFFVAADYVQDHEFENKDLLAFTLKVLGKNEIKPSIKKKTVTYKKPDAPKFDPNKARQQFFEEMAKNPSNVQRSIDYQLRDYIKTSRRNYLKTIPHETITKINTMISITFYFNNSTCFHSSGSSWEIVLESLCNQFKPFYDFFAV